MRVEHERVMRMGASACGFCLLATQTLRCGAVMLAPNHLLSTHMWWCPRILCPCMHAGVHPSSVLACVLVSCEHPVSTHRCCTLRAWAMMQHAVYE